MVKSFIFGSALLLSCAAPVQEDSKVADIIEQSGLHYNVHTTIDPHAQSLEATVNIHNPLSSDFFLHKDFEIISVLADGRPVSYRLGDGSLFFTPLASNIVVDADSIRNLDITYRGTLPGPILDVNMLTPDLVELGLFPSWYPIFNDGPLPANHSFNLEAKLPDDYVVVSNGIRTGENTWSSDRDNMAIGIVASPHFKVMEAELNGMKAQSYYVNLSDEFIQGRMDQLLQSMEWFKGRYGEPQDLPTPQFIYSPRSSWGYVLSPAFMVSEKWTENALQDPYTSAMDLRYSVHEVAHFWWLITDDVWLDEGLAEFSAFRYLREHFDTSISDRRYQEYVEQAQTATTPIAECKMESPDREAIHYAKVPLLFINAQEQFGEDNLDNMLRNLYARSADKKITTDAFLDQVKKDLGDDSFVYFRDAVYYR